MLYSNRKQSRQQQMPCYLLLLLFPQLYLWGSPFWERFLHMWPYFNSSHWGNHIPSSWMVHARCVFVAGIHTFRTWMSGSFEFVQWNSCVNRLDLSLYYIPRVLGGMESETVLTPREKSPLLEKFSSEEDQTHNAASSRAACPTHYQQAIPAPPCYQMVVFQTGKDSLLVSKIKYQVVSDFNRCHDRF